MGCMEASGAAADYSDNCKEASQEASMLGSDDDRMHMLFLKLCGISG